MHPKLTEFASDVRFAAELLIVMAKEIESLKAELSTERMLTQQLQTNLKNAENELLMQMAKKRR
jgi:hypothetical protein